MPEVSQPYNIGDCVAADAVGTPATDNDAMRVAMGWNDGRLQKPYPLEYDAWETNDQINYEVGRRAVAAARYYTRRIPAWGPNDNTDSIERAFRNGRDKKAKNALRAAEEESAWGLTPQPPPTPLVSRQTVAVLPAAVQELLARMAAKRLH